MFERLRGIKEPSRLTPNQAGVVMTKEFETEINRFLIHGAKSPSAEALAAKFKTLFADVPSADSQAVVVMIGENRYQIECSAGCWYHVHMLGTRFRMSGRL